MPKKRQRSLYILSLIFIILTAGIVSAGYRYYRHYEENYRVEVECRLSAIAKLKVEELAHWRNERLGDAGIFYKNAAFSALVQRYFETPDDTETQGQLRTWLSQAQTANEYERISLFDAQGIERISAPDTYDPIPHPPQDIAKSLHSEKVSFMDFSRHSAYGLIHLNTTVPVIAGQKENQAIGFIVLCINPEKYLYPFINQWPTRSKTAETLLVRRQGNEVLFLNELRFKKNTALNLRFPLDNKELPAVKAVLGQQGIVEGTNYRGVPVIAFVCAVPDSPWFLVANMDASEVYAPIKEKLWVTLVLAGALLIGAGAGISFIWKQQLAGFNRQKCEASKLLMSSEEKYQSLVEASPDWIWEVDKEGVYTYVSPRVEDLLGYQVGDVLGKTPFDFMPEKEAAGIRKIFVAKMVKREPFYRLENTNRHKDGHLVFLESSGAPAFDDDGQFQGYRGVDRDISKRRQAEEAIKKLNKDLKSTVALFTQSNRQLREFAYLAAHDLKTPLRGISTLVQWLVDDYKEKFDDKGRQQVDLLVARVGRMDELVSAILEYSTIGRDRREEHPVDLNKLVGTVLVETKPPPNIKITINKILPVVVCDERHLRQIFHRLLANAVKFMDKPDGHIAIDYTDKDDLWEFSVSDNGMGIAPQHFEKIFQLFQTLNDPDQSKCGGVGLTFVRKIVELYGGQIWLTSEPGKGSTFFFTLPKVISFSDNEKLLLTASS